MATPVNNSTEVLPQSPQEPAAASPVQQGVGAAPTTIQSAVNETSVPSASQERGYIYRFVVYIRDWIVWLFSKLFCCKSQEMAPQQTPSTAPVQEQTATPQQQVPPPSTPPVEPRLRINDEVRLDMNLLDHFRTLPEETQKRIYYLIGERSSWYFSPRNYFWFSSYEDIGRRAVEQNPQLLGSYLQRT